jgi:RNA polymerase sigma-70 factor (ECF subfamily)
MLPFLARSAVAPSAVLPNAGPGRRGVGGLPGYGVFVGTARVFQIPFARPSMTGEAQPEPSENDLIRLAREGDRGAFGALVRAHQTRSHALAIRMLGSRTEADDAVQETYLRAWRGLRTFDGRSQLSTWLHRICVNVCLNIIRRRRKTRADEFDDARVPTEKASTAGDPAEAADTRRSYETLARALEALSPSLKATAVLVLLEGKSLRDAGEILGCPEGTVAWRVHEARRKLREALMPSSSSSPGKTSPGGAAPLGSGAGATRGDKAR